MTIKPLPLHPVCAAFPLLRGADFDLMVASVRQVGLREPILTWRGQVVDGQNRQAACLAAGVEPAYREYEGAEEDMIREVLARNVARRHMDESARAMAAARLTRVDPRSANLHSAITADAAADMLNVSRRAVMMARKVLQDGAPDLVDQVDRGAMTVTAAETAARMAPPDQARIVEAVTKGAKAPVAVRQAQRDRKVRKLAGKAAAWPEGKYGVIYADPPWPFETWGPGGGNRSPENHYPLMALEEIAAMDVAGLAAPDSVLFLWATTPQLANALKVLEAWGFEYRSHWVWKKDKGGTGHWGINNHEVLLIGVKGAFPAPAQGEAPLSCLEYPRGRHSEKPEIYAQVLEELWPGLPRIELFRRGPARPGWDAWGNEAETCVEEAAE
ncbi:MAG: MT-A70 family methyltransferase [Magnetospirillum sp. WYHS-4]